MECLELADTILHYDEQGQGEPLLLVHGSASDYRMWEPQREAFGNHFRFIAYSRRFHWPNKPIADDADYSMDQHVEDLRSVIRSLDLGPVHLVGHSYGGFLSLLAAIREPNLVRSLVLAEPPAITLFVSNTPKPLEILRLLMSRPKAALAVVKFGAKGVVPASKAFRRGDTKAGIEIFGRAVFGGAGYYSLSPSRREQVDDNLSNVKAELLGSGFLPVVPEELRGLQIPCLLVTGERSIDLFRLVVDQLEELLPRTERAEIPGGSHLMNEDNAPAFNQAVTAFLAKGLTDLVSSKT